MKNFLNCGGPRVPALVVLASIAVVVSFPGCKREPSESVPVVPKTPVAATPVNTAPKPPSPETERAPDGGLVRVVHLEVTPEGFVPRVVSMKVGETVRLAVKRTTDETCGTEILVTDTAINQPLPLNQEVSVSYTAAKPGNVKFGCAMKMMVGGVLHIE